MSPTSGNNFLHEYSSPENISILVVSSHSEDGVALNRILHNEQYCFTTVGSVREAKAFLARRDAAVIVCERDVPDGSWYDLADRNSALVVVSRQADDALWSNVLNRGGYDVLQKPFQRSEVTRVLGMAWRNTFSRRHREEARMAMLAAQA